MVTCDSVRPNSHSSFTDQKFYSLRENETAFDRYRIRPRVLVNVDNIDTSTEILDTKARSFLNMKCSIFQILTTEQVSLPFGFSPAASHKLAHQDGELATSRAAAKFGICMGLSSYATYPLEDVAAQGLGNPYVMQMCVLKDRSITLQLLERAESRWSISMPFDST